MITSELREYCEGVISYYSKDYPYYFMCTNTVKSGNSYSQQGAYVYLSKTEPTVNNQFSMKSDEWLRVYVKSSNANLTDHSDRVAKTTVRGTVTCNSYEYVYSNVNSTYAFSSVPTHYNDAALVKHETDTIFSVFMCARMLACVVAVWIKR